VTDSADHDPQDAGVATAGHERLRSAVLSGSAGGWRLGHGALSGRGMVAWMRTIGEAAPAARPAAVTPLPVADADQVVAVLARMVLPLAA
jgi:hypothetical protein